MQKIKNNSLLIMSLVLTIVFCSPIAFINAEELNQVDAKVNQNNNRNQNNVNIDKDNNKLNGDSHRSAVATFVQNLLDVANRDKSGIGDQVRAIANAQNDSKEDVASEIEKVQNRNGFKTFLIGTDYKSMGQLRSEMVTTENQIKQLTVLLDKTTDAMDKAVIQAQIQVLTQEQQKINDFIKTNESKFSLFGWLVKLFN
jgi:hypothetical protein